MLGANETPYDLRFRLLGIPVRIHPLFWLVSAVLGWQDGKLDEVALWVVCIFVSIMVHEFGHALVAKAYYCNPSVLLYAMGGLCFSQIDRHAPRQRLAVILAGPGAGFVLFGILILTTSILFRITPSEHLATVQSMFGFSDFPWSIAAKIKWVVQDRSAAHYLTNAYWHLARINLLWGLVNLLPLWPLDGGQAAQILLTYIDRSRGPRRGHIVSLLVAGGLAILVFSRSKDWFLVLFFASFAFINYQVLQSMHQAHSIGISQDDDWWRR